MTRSDFKKNCTQLNLMLTRTQLTAQVGHISSYHVSSTRLHISSHQLSQVNSIQLSLQLNASQFIPSQLNSAPHQLSQVNSNQLRSHHPPQQKPISSTHNSCDVATFELTSKVQLRVGADPMQVVEVGGDNVHPVVLALNLLYIMRDLLQL